MNTELNKYKWLDSQEVAPKSVVPDENKTFEKILKNVLLNFLEL